jgi:hypothetical protein
VDRAHLGGQIERRDGCCQCGTRLLCVAVAVDKTALFTSVLAADLRGCWMARLRSACRTRLMADGVRAPVQPRWE